MNLTIKYKSGEVRRITLHKEFFKPCELGIPKRALDAAYSFAPDPYSIAVTRGNDIVHEQLIRNNIPEKQYIFPKKIDEKDIKKQLRRQFKHVPLRKISFSELNSF